LSAEHGLFAATASGATTKVDNSKESAISPRFIEVTLC
jgi:hypothetical protein